MSFFQNVQKKALNVRIDTNVRRVTSFLSSVVSKVEDDITTFLERVFSKSDEFGSVTRDVLIEKVKRDFINSPLNQPR